MAEADSNANTNRPGRQMRVRVDERNLETHYCNAFRSNVTSEELILDVGVNIARPANEGPEPADGEASQPEVLFQVDNRLIMNFYTAKRLAMALGQLVQRHEQQYGELPLDASQRRKQGGA